VRAPPILRGGRAAASFLTRVPVGGFPYSSEDFRWASAWFPAVGLGLGLVLAAVFLGATRAGHPVAAAITVTASLMLTGAFHEDGLADTADALGGAYSRERVFEILKDSRVGTFGSVALTCSVLLRVLLLARLEGFAPAALVLSQCVSRVSPIWLMVAMPYVSAEDASRSKVVTRAGAPQAALATAFGGAVVLGAALLGHLSAWEVAAIAFASFASFALTGWRYRDRAGGVTGDFLGATQQVGECALLLALAIARGGAA
jgi:adenosylcobinamide-GDP ribazoletransferase